MKPLLDTAFGGFAFSLMLTLATVPADAKGCIKGALVGGIAGHAAHHGLIGAAAGCAIGHHEAAKRERERAQQNQPSGAAPATAPDPGKYQ